MLRYSKEKLEEEDSVTAIYFRAQKELQTRKKLYEEFRRKPTDEELASYDSEHIKVPLQRYLAIMIVGFFAGMPPVYKTHAYDKEIDELNQSLFGMPKNNEQIVKEMEFIIRHITDYNDDGREFFSLAFDYFVKRACYEILYKNQKGEYVYSKSDALETVAIWDFSVPKNLIGLYRIIETTLANGEYQTMVELTTLNGKKYYMDTPEKRKLFSSNPEEYNKKYGDEPLFKEDKSKFQPKKWCDIPAIAIENEHNLNVFENVDSLIDAYETVIQNQRNIHKYNDEAKFKLKGYKAENKRIIPDKNGNPVINPAREKEDEYVLKSRVVYIEDGGEADWIIKSINDNAIQNHKKTLMDLICLCAFVPNMTDLGFTQADNNSALEKKFFALQQLIVDADSDFKMGIQRRWELIFDKFNKEKQKTYDFRNVEVKLQRNMPSDSASLTSIVMQLRELLSDETLIGLLPFDFDPKNEIAKKKQEEANSSSENEQLMKRFRESQNKNDDISVKEESSEN